jgi:uncharacterized protein YdaU (DUF1376 family)
MARRSNNNHVLPLFCDDLIASCVEMSPACFGAYMRLLCYAWTRGGIPDDYSVCSRITGGFSESDWNTIRERLVPTGDTGKLSHPRLEAERAAVTANREKNRENGKKGGRPSSGKPKQEPNVNPSVTQTETQADDEQNPKESSHSLSHSHREEDNSRAGRRPPAADGAADEPGQRSRPGWVHDEWARIVAVWNATERAVPWTLATPPNGFADQAASPGWVESALTAIALLPQCRRFERPVPWTQFVREIDRILAGEFRDPREERRELAAVGGRQQRRGNMR